VSATPASTSTGYAEIGGVVHVLSTDLQAAHDCLQKAGFRILRSSRCC
jgi:hypothetical protein